MQFQHFIQQKGKENKQVEVVILISRQILKTSQIQVNV